MGSKSNNDKGLRNTSDAKTDGSSLPVPVDVPDSKKESIKTGFVKKLQEWFPSAEQAVQAAAQKEKEGLKTGGWIGGLMRRATATKEEREVQAARNGPRFSLASGGKAARIAFAKEFHPAHFHDQYYWYALTDGSFLASPNALQSEDMDLDNQDSAIVQYVDRYFPDSEPADIVIPRFNGKVEYVGFYFYLYEEDGRYIATPKPLD
jgi:hypothetical protein